MGKPLQQTALLLINRIDLRISNDEVLLSPAEVSELVRIRSKNWITTHLKHIAPEELFRVFLSGDIFRLKHEGRKTKSLEEFERTIDAIRHFTEEMLIVEMGFILQTLKYAEYGPCDSHDELVRNYVDGESRKTHAKLSGMHMNIPVDKNYPPDAVQCDDCGGHGCKICDNKGWLPAGHPKGRLCALDGCENPIPPDHVAIYCTNSCAAQDA